MKEITEYCNLQEENRGGYIVSAQKKSIWNIQLKMLQKLIDVCNKHNLKIWADAGTLIGVVREHGFVPWDDDIDMVMMREDYDKLVSIASSEFADPYFFQCAYTDKLYPRGHAQLRYNGTAAILPNEVWCKFNQSIFIDIFVYDELPKDRIVMLKNMLKAELLRKMLNMRVYWRCSPNIIRRVVKFVVSGLFFSVFGFKKIFRKFDKYYSNPDGELSDDLSCPTFNASLVFKLVKKKSWYAETIYMPFENISIPVPVGYDEILKNQYGDYMTPVQAPTMHGNVIFDTKRSYKEVLKDIKSGKIGINNYLHG